MYLLNSKDAQGRRSIILKNGNEEIRVNAEMVKFASQQIGCTEAEIYEFLKSGVPEEPKPSNLFARAKELKGQ
jgi:hypothetical protein